MNSGTKVVRTIMSLTETEQIFVFTWFPIYELIFKSFLKGKNVTIDVKGRIAKSKSKKK